MPRKHEGGSGIDDDFEEILAACLDEMETRGLDRLEEVVQRFPEHRERLRELIGSLTEFGLVGDQPEEHTDLPAQRLGGYRLVRRIGQGGMGMVFLAVQESVGRPVAIKTMHPALAANPETVERFKREAQAVARLRHPHIVTLHDAGEDEGLLYCVMEFIPGRGLDEILAAAVADDDPIRVPVLLRWARQVAGALDCAHEEGIIHRDVKPSNLRITPNGEAKLIDFGLARDVTAETPDGFRSLPRFAPLRRSRADRGGAQDRTDDRRLRARHHAL